MYITPVSFSHAEYWESFNGLSRVPFTKIWSGILLISRIGFRLNLKIFKWKLVELHCTS